MQVNPSYLKLIQSQLLHTKFLNKYYILRDSLKSYKSKCKQACFLECPSKIENKQIDKQTLEYYLCPQSSMLHINTYVLINT